MTAFELAVEAILRHEGGYSDHPLDEGGPTKYGISQRSYPARDIAALTVADAKEIYLVEFWNRLNLDLLPPPLALVVFDSAVNHGRVRAVTLLQEAVGAHVDGIMGPQTIRTSALAELPWALTDLCARRMFFYGTLDNFQTFGLGWSRRLLDIHATALSLVA